MKRKSVYSKRLEEYASSLPDAYENFVLAMSVLPQKKGVDRALWEWVKENKPKTADEMSKRYCNVTLRKGK